MNIINTIEDWNALIASEAIFTNKRIVIGGKTITIQGFASSWITFENCSFECSNLDFLNINNPDQRVEFNNCTFNCNVNVTNCVMEHFEFVNTVSIKSLNIEKGLHEFCRLEMNYFGFVNKPDSNTNDLNTLFTFNKCHFDKFAFEGIRHIGGRFKFIENTLGKKENRVSHILFKNSQIFNGYFSLNKFEQITSFFNCNFSYNERDLESAGYKSTGFYKNTFDKVIFNNCNFNDMTLFVKCEFNDIAYFENIRNIENSELKLDDCRFNKYATFTGAKIKRLSLEKTSFHDIVSFQDSHFDTILIDKPNFDKVTYFDGIKINQIEKCDRRTLRNIKQQLQKAENKIDYNSFRSYELSAFYRELKWFGNFKDKFILGATWLATGFDHSWRRALLFTIVFGLIFYTILYRIEHPGAYDPGKWEGYYNGSYRFFLVTDFYSPFEHQRVYLENGWSGLVMILGKIVIAFGIYEMIQAFRKFKA